MIFCCIKILTVLYVAKHQVCNQRKRSRDDYLSVYSNLQMFKFAKPGTKAIKLYTSCISLLVLLGRKLPN